jgi:hypothetical protein
VEERLPINKSIFWSDRGLARKIYRNLAIIPRVQQGPTKQEIKKRVTQVIGRPSKMDFGSYEGIFARDSMPLQGNSGDAIMQCINEDTPTMETICEEQLPDMNEGSNDKV